MDNNLQTVATASDWRAIVAAWRNAAVAYRAHPYCSAHPSASEYDDLQRDADKLHDAEAFALDAVMDSPVPDHTALIEKLEIIKAEFGNDDYYMDRVIADVRRLGGI